MKIPFRNAIGLVLIFILGLLAGLLLARAIVRHEAERLIAGGPEEVGRFVARRLALRLRLDESQRQQLLALTGEMQKEFRTIRASVQPQIDAVITKTITDINAILTEKQRIEFQRITAPHRAAWEQPLPAESAHDQ